MQSLEDRIETLKKFRATLDGKNDFEVLDLSTECDDSAVRAGYFGQLKKFNADFFHGAPADVMEIVNFVNKRLRDAYDHLQTKDKRAAALEAIKAAKAAADAGEPLPEVNNEPVDLATVFESEQALTRATSLMERGDYAIALKHLETAQKGNPSSREIKSRLAFSRYMVMEVDDKGRRPADKVNETRAFLTQMIEEDKKEEGAKNLDYNLMYLAELEKLEDNVDKALGYYKEAYKISKSPAAQREIHLIENRKNRATAPSADTKKSLIDQIKEVFSGLLKK